MRFWVLTAIASLGGLLFGYDTGVISGALLQIRRVFDLSATMQDLVTAIVLVGASAGAAIAGWSADRFGRRRVILAVAALFAAGALLSALAPSLALLILGRLLVGAAIGVASMLVPLYLAEISPPEKRGGIVSLNQFCITLGILLSYLVDYLFAGMADGWRWMLGLGCVPGLVLGSGMLFLPESPRWLAAQGDTQGALAALRRAGIAQPDAVLAQMRRDSSRHGPWKALLQPPARRALLVGVGLAVFQQITGINTVIYYAPTIFQQAGMGTDQAAILATAGVGLVNVVMTVVAMRLLDVSGRRGLLLAGLGGMAATLALLAAAFALGDPQQLAWITAVAVAAYVGAFAIGLGPVFWLMIAEIFPLSVRGRGMSIATMANWLSNLAVALVFLDLIRLIGGAGVFLMFCLCTLACIAFTWIYVPETKGRSLEQIEDLSHGMAAEHVRET